MKNYIKKCSALLMSSVMVAASTGYLPTPSYTVSADISSKKGDVNGDGKVDLTDAQTVLRAALAITELNENAQKCADANGDGKVDLTDAQLILKAALAIIDLEDDEEDKEFEINRNQQYAEVLCCVNTTGYWPEVYEKNKKVNMDSYLCGDNGSNYFNIADIDGDGSEELVIHTCRQEYVVYAYDEQNNKAVRTIEKSGPAGEEEFEKEYPAVKNCEWKSLYYDIYRGYTDTYVNYYADKVSEDYTEKDIAVLFIRNNNSDWNKLISELNDMLGNPDEENEYYIGWKSISYALEDGGYITYSDEPLENVTMFGICPGMDKSEADNLIRKYGFHVKSDSNDEIFYLTGSTFGSLTVGISFKNGKVTGIYLIGSSAYAG